MTQFLNDQLLTRVVPEFAHTLADGHAVNEVLSRLAGHVVEIFDADGAGVALVDQQGALRPVTGVNELSAWLEATQEGLQEGPCVDAFHNGCVVCVPDLDREPDAWPRWRIEARQRDVRAVLGLPLRVRAEALGAVDVYSTRPREWDEAEVTAAQVLTVMAASYVVNASALADSRRTSEQLREALASRVVIEQAKGVLANHLGCTVDQAFHVLREHAPRNSANLRTVAHAVVHLGLRPSRKPGER